MPPCCRLFPRIRARMSGKRYAELYRAASAVLPSAFEADLLFEAATGLRRYDLPLRGETLAPAEAEQALLALCTRRAGGEPLQYLLGEWEFFGLPFLVGPGVLIPRADTEILVETALALAPKKSHLQVLDLCSGSGCVAVALAHSLPHAEVTAVELSAEAFFYLQKNIALNSVKVTAVKADIAEYTPLLAADIITCNPPYISIAEMGGLQQEVLREPHMALCGGEDGLDFYRLLAKRYVAQLAQGGVLCAEVGINQSRDVLAIFSAAGLTPIEIRSDFAGVERVVAVRKENGGEV